MHMEVIRGGKLSIFGRMLMCITCITNTHKHRTSHNIVQREEMFQECEGIIIGTVLIDTGVTKQHYTLCHPRVLYVYLAGDAANE